MSVRLAVWLAALWPAATSAAVTPYPPFQGAVPSVAYKVALDGQAINEVSAKPGGGVLFFPAGIYLTGTVSMKSNVKLYIDAGALIRGSTKNADYPTVPTPAGARQFRALIVFNGVENASLARRGGIDMDGYPRLWHDFQPDTGDGRARDADGRVLDPHRNGIRGYVIN